MSDYLKDVLSVSEKYQTTIRKLCQPLVDLGIDYVGYQTVRDDGTYSLAINGLAYGQHYLANQVYQFDPFIRHPKYFQSGLLLLEDVVSMSHYSEYVGYIKKVQNDFKFDIVFGLFDRTPNEISCMSFATKRKAPNQLSNYLKELPLFQKFSRYFLEEGKSVIKTMNSNRVDLLPLLKDEFYISPLQPLTQMKDSTRQRFLNTIQVVNGDTVPVLTPQEKQCLLGLLKGNSAKQTAQDLELSYRTVEFYLAKIKHKLNCSGKGELFKAAQKLQAAGILPALGPY